MLVSQFVSGVSAEFSLVHSGNQLTATFYYGLTGFEDEEGISHWDGEIGTDIGYYGDYLQQTADRPMDLQLVATMTPGKATTASYFVNDNIGGASFDHQFSVTIFNTAATFVGTSAVDLAFGSAAADEFRSVGAGDMFEGGAGNDLYRIYSADTKIFEAVGQGTFDRIAAGISYVLAAGVEVEQMTTNSSGGTGAINLTGNAFSQTIYGNAGANILRDGGGAGDILIGLGGNDTFQIYSTATKIQEGAGQGTADRVMAGVSYTLAAGLDIEIMTTNGSAGTAKVDLTGNDLVQTMIGNAADNRLDGAGGSDSLLGEAGNDTLIGALGNDILDGGSGADTLIGGKGRDIYYVDDAKDAVVELIDGNNGDRVVAEVSYVLGAGVWVEQLMTTSATGTQAINLTGNAMQQLIVGNAGDNILNDGGAGTPDELRGMGGNDTYYVYNHEDIIVEREGDGTLDVVITNSDFRLAEGVFVERLVLQNPFATNGSHLYGNEVGQTIIGNVGNDVIQTGGGMDTLTGLGGADTFVISALPGAGNFVKITDFNPATETIQLANTAFNTLTVPGTLAGSAFWSNTTGLAHDFSDRIIYETDTGKLYYDEDGVESEPAIHFATLQAGLSLTAADFIVINA